MNLVDSSGWLEYFTQGDNAGFFASPILATDDLVVPTIAIFEVFRRTLRARGRAAAYQVVAQMRRARIIDLDRKLAVAAAKLSLQTKLAMADSIVLASAWTVGATLWTQDVDFKHFDGVKYRAKTPS